MVIDQHAHLPDQHTCARVGVEFHGLAGDFKISPADFPLLAEETRRRAAGAGRRDSYDDIVRTRVVAGRFGVEDVTGLPWTEVDFPKDVEFARTKVLPAIQRRELVAR